MTTKETENELLFAWIDNIEFRNKLSSLVIEARSRRRRFETQKQVADVLEISLTKIKQIEKGTSKDVNAIVNYLGFQGIYL